jgi:diapolycopene oxygenase
MTTHKRDKKVLVVGGGLGGISAAISLATRGFEVELFEKNDRIGGKLNVMELEGFSFDLGPSIIILPQIFRRLFERAGRRMEDYVELQELTPQWRSFFEDGTVIDLHPDMRLMEAELERFGEAAAGYWEFIEYSRMLWKFAEEAYLERGADSIKEIMSGHGVYELVKKTDLFASMDQGVSRRIREPHLRDMLNFFIKYVGSSAYDAPALLNLLPYSQLGYGLWYVKGGMYNLARGFGRLMEELGVKVHLGAEVVELPRTPDGRRVTGVRLEGGEEHRADVVVSNMEVIPAYKRLLGVTDGLMMKRYEYMYEPAASGLVVHIGVDRHYPQLRHHNFFFSRDPRGHFDAIHRRKQLPEDATIYMVSPTVTDPGLAPEGCHIIKILPHIPYVQDPPYTQGDYEALKQRQYDKLERMGLTDLRRHIVLEHVLTPDDLQRMYYSNRGAIYGVLADRKRNYSLKAPKKSARFDNLYFVGGSVNPGGGTPMVVLSGQKACELIVRDHS